MNGRNHLLAFKASSAEVERIRALAAREDRTTASLLRHALAVYARIQDYDLSVGDGRGGTNPAA